MIGTMMLTAMGTAVNGLANAMYSFYEDYNLADAWARVGAIPLSEVERLRNIPGVADVSARTIMEVRAGIGGSDDMIVLRVFSFAPGEENRINDFAMNGVEPSLQNDIALSEMFNAAHGLETGDAITLYAQGRALSFRTTGTFLAPEYIYIARGGTEMLPDNLGFGIAYITEDAMTTITGRPGVANEVLFTLQDGYDFESVQGHLQNALQPYGLITLLNRDAQLSYMFLDMEVRALESVSTSMPFVFVALAVVVLYLMLKRIIEQERTQIGVLKAFGYSNFELVLHYMAYGGITGLIGGLLGFAYGAALSGFYLAMFLEFFLMPELVQPVSPMYLLASLGIAVGGGLLGAFMGAVKALQLTPSEAMRPESPKPIKYDIVGKIKGLTFILNSRGQMALRSVIRNPVRSGFVIIGVTFSFMMLVVFGDMEGMVDTLLYSQFQDVRHYSVRATLNRPVDFNQAIEAAYAIPHITQAEALWELPVTLSNRHIQSGTVITGIPADSVLFSVFDSDLRRAFPPPTNGLIITNGLADNLHAVAGDILYISTHLSENDIPIVVERVVTQNIGSGAFLEINTLAALVNHPAVASAIIFNSDDIAFVTDYLKESPLVGTVDSIQSTLQQYLDMMEPYSAIYSIMFMMGVAIAFAIIYNTATISLSERQREFATLRVLGLTVDEVCEIMRFEYWVLAAIGMLLGIPAADALLVAINMLIDTDMMSMPTNIQTRAYAMAAFGCAAAIMLSNFSAKRKIRKFNMVEVLKERE
jgi:putative ABC transport system permease protein